MPTPSTLAEHQSKLHKFSCEGGEDFLRGTMTKTWSWPFVNLVQDGANPFDTGLTERTAAYVHIIALSQKKAERAMGTVLLLNFGLLCFLF